MTNMSNMNNRYNEDFQKIKYIVNRIAKSKWRYYNIVDGNLQWVGGEVIESETGKSYPVKTTDELIEFYLNEYK